MIPSIKTLEHAFPGKGKELRALLTGEKDPNGYESVQAWIRQCYNYPCKNDLVAKAVNEVLEGYGVESLMNEDSLHAEADYINMGDPYVATLLYEYDKRRWIVTSWGDWMEAQERKSYRKPARSRF